MKESLYRDFRRHGYSNFLSKSGCLKCGISSIRILRSESFGTASWNLYGWKTSVLLRILKFFEDFKSVALYVLQTRPTIYPSLQPLVSMDFNLAIFNTTGLRYPYEDLHDPLIGSVSRFHGVRFRRSL